MNKILMVAAAAMFVSACSPREDAQPEAHTTDEATATEASSATTDTSMISELTDYAAQIDEWSGEVRMVNYWATWCAPCRREIPLLKTLQDNKQDDGIQVVGIAVDYMEDVLKYAEEAQFNYPVLVGQEAAMDAAESSGVEFIGLPFTVVLSADGDLINTHIGEIKEEHIERIVEVTQSLGRGDIDLEAAREQLHGL